MVLRFIVFLFLPYAVIMAVFTSFDVTDLEDRVVALEAPPTSIPRYAEVLVVWRFNNAIEMAELIGRYANTVESLTAWPTCDWLEFQMDQPRWEEWEPQGGDVGVCRAWVQITPPPE